MPDPETDPRQARIADWHTRPAQAEARGATVNALSVDVEDYFQVEAFARLIDRAEWPARDCRVEANVDRLLALFGEGNAKATFFTLGWVAERYKPMIRRIVAAGHELGSHGSDHHRVDQLGPERFRADVIRAKGVLEDAGGVPITGYRAPTFSINAANPWAHEILAETGHLYSSSVYPVRHDLYGEPAAPRFAFHPIAGSPFLEIPVTTAERFGVNVPSGGGGYFRLLPYALSAANMRRVNRRDRRACMFYFHPWEIDPGQPVVDGTTLRTRIRHYTNLAAMEGRLRRLLADFAFDRTDRVFASALGAGHESRSLAAA